MDESSSTSIKFHRTESIPSNNFMGHHHHHRPLLSSPNSTDDGGGCGPYQNDSGANEVERSTTTAPPTPNITTCPSRRNCSSDNIFLPDRVTVTSESWISGVAAADAERNLQPFDSCSITLTNTVSKSQGGGGGSGIGMAAAAAAAALGFPFTAVQWKELERQSMIYKYMMASVPVPSHLLLPADPTAAPLGSNGDGSLYNLRCGNTRNLEPGRCKRTDGKKWRCSRGVAPHQKYCERHVHRGRPRSRKPVELHSSSLAVDNTNTTTNNNKKSCFRHSPLHPNSTAQPNNNSSPQFPGSSTIQQPKGPVLLDASIDQNIFASSNYKEPNRFFGWTMDSEVVAANGVEQEWLHLMDTKRRGELAPTQENFIYGTNASILQQGYCEEEPLNLFSYSTTDFASSGSIHSRNDQYHLFLNSDLVASKQPQVDQYCASRGFIDAWPNGDLKIIDESSVPSSKGNNLSSPSLTLSMAMVAGNVLDEGMRLAVDSHLFKPKDCPVSWLPFTSAGPLGEVLQPNSVACGSNPASPYTSNGDSINSSPTGILLKPLFSQSDSGVCNSLTLAASAAPPEGVAFRWLS